MEEFNEIYEQVVSNLYHRNVLKCFEGLSKEWEITTIPRDLDNIYQMSEQVCTICLAFKTYKTASQIVPLIYCINLRTIRDGGEEEKVIAENVYGLDNLEVAKELFVITNKLSSGVKLRAEQYKVYRDLINNKVQIEVHQTLRGRLKIHLANAHIERKDEVEKEFNGVLDKWEKLKEPRILKAKAYEIIKQFVLLCIKYQLFDLGNECIGLVLTRASKKEDNGESELIAGILAYKQDHMAVAQQFFTIADQKSKGACWEGQENKCYQALLQAGEIKLVFDNEIYEAAKRIEPRKEDEEEVQAEEPELTELPDELYEKVSDLYDEGDQLSGDAAIAMFRKGLALLPGDAGDWEIGQLLYAAIADEYFDKGEYNEASNYYDYAGADMGTDNPYLLFGKAKSNYELGYIEAATELFMQVYMLDGDKLFKDEDSKYFDCIKKMVE